MSDECMYAWIRKSDFERCNADLDRLEAENAELRAERDEWHRVAKSKQDIIDHMRDARAENAKLRELVRDMWCDITKSEACGWDIDANCCTGSDSCIGECSYWYRMRELGVEVPYD